MTFCQWQEGSADFVKICIGVEGLEQCIHSFVDKLDVNGSRVLRDLTRIKKTHYAYDVILPHEKHHSVCLRSLKQMRALVTQILQCRALKHEALPIPNGPMLTYVDGRPTMGLGSLVTEYEFSQPAPLAHTSLKPFHRRVQYSADRLQHITEALPVGGAVRGCHPPQLDTLQSL